jgi:hypothetical protein
MIKAKDQIVWRKKGDLLVVLDTGSGAYFTLNATAMDLWIGVVEEGGGLEAVAGRIAEKYGEAPVRAQVEADCRRMLGEWQSAGLVEEASQAPTA